MTTTPRVAEVFRSRSFKPSFSQANLSHPKISNKIIINCYFNYCISRRIGLFRNKQRRERGSVHWFGENVEAFVLPMIDLDEVWKANKESCKFNETFDRTL